MPDFSDLLKNIDPKTLQDGIEKASMFAKTEEGKRLIENIKKSNPKDKNDIMSIMAKNPEIKKSIEKFFE